MWVRLILCIVVLRMLAVTARPVAFYPQGGAHAVHGSSALFGGRRDAPTEHATMREGRGVGYIRLLLRTPAAGTVYLIGVVCFMLRLALRYIFIYTTVHCRMYTYVKYRACILDGARIRGGIPWPRGRGGSSCPTRLRGRASSLEALLYWESYVG